MVGGARRGFFAQRCSCRCQGPSGEGGQRNEGTAKRYPNTPPDPLLHVSLLGQPAHLLGRAKTLKGGLGGGPGIRKKSQLPPGRLGTLSTCPRGMDTRSLMAPPLGQSLPTARRGKEVGSKQRREIGNLATLPVLQSSTL